MSVLIDLWNTSRDQVTSKRISQLISFAGEGRLLDGNTTSNEIRSLLKVVSSDVIAQWLDECLEDRFSDFGFLLQDAINEIGRRLGFEVIHGVYRGHSNEGYDGLWTIPGGRALILESKSSTSYSINLSRISDYRKQVAPQLGVRPDDISILIVVGTEDTSEFEAQVRGSRFAWDIRLLGVKSLLRLLKLKEALDDPKVEMQIQEILFPQEFTRLDGIIDLVFATAEDAQDDDVDEIDDSPANSEVEHSKPKANFHAAILPRLEQFFGQSLVQRSRSQWATPDDKVLVSCRVSKQMEKGPVDFWFGLKRPSRESLEKHRHSFCAFGLGSPDRVIVLPMKLLSEHLDGFFSSPDKEGGILHWHVRFAKTKEGIAMLVDRDRKRLDVTEFLLSNQL